MIRWSYEQLDLFTFWIEIQDEYGRKLYPSSTISSPAFSILSEVLTDYLFAKEIYSNNKIFNYDDLCPEEKMDLQMCCLSKLEDIGDE